MTKGEYNFFKNQLMFMKALNETAKDVIEEIDRKARLKKAIARDKKIDELLND